jgi:hypothetical protein
MKCAAVFAAMGFTSQIHASTRNCKGSHQFPIGRQTPDATKQVDESTLFLWRAPRS